MANIVLLFYSNFLGVFTMLNETGRVRLSTGIQGVINLPEPPPVARNSDPSSKGGDQTKFVPYNRVDTKTF